MTVFSISLSCAICGGISTISGVANTEKAIALIVTQTCSRQFLLSSSITTATVASPKSRQKRASTNPVKALASRSPTTSIAVHAHGKTYAGMGVVFQDYDNDGLADLVITNLANQKYALYHNSGDSSFTYDSYMSGLGGMTLLHSGWGVRFLDYDNDGRKDLLVAQGHDLDTIELNFPQLRYKEPMLLARNTGKGFVDVSAQSGDVFHQAWVGRGMAVGDIDN